MRRVMIIVAAVAVPGVLAGACSKADAICDLICECEHCNDFREDLECALWNNSEEVAAIYGCESEFEGYATCFEDKGRCEEEEANFTTSAPGDCSASQDTGFSCTTAADCAAFSSDATCEGGTCRTKACAGDMFPCDTDADCSGEDECDDEQEELANCIAEASDDPSVAGIVDD